METETEPTTRKTVSLPVSMWQQVEDFQFERRIKKDAVAIRRLIELGLEAAREQQKAS